LECFYDHSFLDSCMYIVYNCIHMLDFIKNKKGEILNLFFQNTDQELYLREIARILDKEPGLFQRDIESLVKEGILKDERRANLRYFKLNKNYSLYEEIEKIIFKTLGIGAQLQKLVDNLPQIDQSFIFGSIAKNTEYVESDIDLMLIGVVDQDLLIKRINKAEKKLKREVNYVLYGKNEIMKKLKQENDFLMKIFKEPKIILKGNLDEYSKFN
jgi:predicted nucleotidyltransferase/predicted transcriptional regulator with HTH domain